MKSKMTLDKIADRYLSHNSRHTQVPVPATTTVAADSRASRSKNRL